MWFLYLISWLGLVIQLCIVTLSIAAGLYYLAELVEEYTIMAGRVIKYMVYATTAVYVGLFLFEEMSFSLIAFGLASCVAHFFIIQSFPYFMVTSPAFIGALGLIFINHYLAFSFFSTHYYNFTEVLAFFTVCLWLVPFAFFVSLSANENVLPTMTTTEDRDTDVVSNYMRKQKKKSGLLSFFKMAQENLLPDRIRKQF